MAILRDKPLLELPARRTPQDEGDSLVYWPVDRDNLGATYIARDSSRYCRVHLPWGLLEDIVAPLEVVFRQHLEAECPDHLC